MYSLKHPELVHQSCFLDLLLCLQQQQSNVSPPHDAQFYYSHQMSCHFQNTKAQCQMAHQLLLASCILDIGLIQRCIRELEEDNDDNDNDLDLGNGVVRPSWQEQLQWGFLFQLQAISYAHKVLCSQAGSWYCLGIPEDDCGSGWGWLLDKLSISTCKKTLAKTATILTRWLQFLTCEV